MERRKINSIDEIWDGNNLLIEDFSNLDLENIDLSIIPMEKWEDCIFYNTNFSNTNIKFIPNKLKQTIDNNIKVIDISNCDFSDNDLSFLTRNDFCNVDELNVEYGTTLKYPGAGRAFTFKIKNNNKFSVLIDASTFNFNEEMYINGSLITDPDILSNFQ